MQLIAETAWHHEGDFEFMKNLVDDLLDKGHQDVIKCHLTLDLADYMLSDHPAWETLSGWMLEKKAWLAICRRIVESKKTLMLLYNDIKAVEFGQEFHPKLIEVHAVNLNNINLLDGIQQNLMPEQKIVIGVGGNTLEEIDSALHYLRTDRIVLMFGFQNYPTQYRNINLARMRRIMSLFPHFEFGYADHCGYDELNNQLITLFGAAQGCQFIEKHVTTEPGTPRCDYESAISIEQMNELKNALDVLSACNGDGMLELNEAELKYGKMGSMKALAVAVHKLKSGETLQPEMVQFVRTNQTTDLSQVDINRRFGQELVADVKAGTPLNSGHFKI